MTFWRYFIFPRTTKGWKVEAGSNLVGHYPTLFVALLAVIGHNARTQQHTENYIRAREEGMRTNPEGWRHANCDHAYGICSG